MRAIVRTRAESLFFDFEILKKDRAFRKKYRNNTMKQDKLKATARLLEIMDTLREQCPWDRKQTFETLRNNTIEETYELADAILNKDLDGIKEEAGDLL